MLLELRISNFALIDKAEILPGGGFNVLTGETGAGKSILIQALGLLLGERAASEHVGAGGNGKALIEGAFDLSAAPVAKAWLEEHDLADESQLIITREVSNDGRSRVRLNGRMATASALRELGSLLVDLHGQHEGQLLMKPETHLGLLDAFGDQHHDALRENVRTHYQAWRDAHRRVTELSKNDQERAQRLDMLQFQAKEIDTAAPEAGEDDKLNEERDRLMNAEKLRGAALLCREALNGDEAPGALALASQALKAAREIEELDSSIAAWVEELQSAIHELEDAALEARAYADSLDSDPQRLEAIEARLHRLGRIKRKYGATVDEVLEYRQKIEEEMQELNLSDETIAGLQAEVEAKKAGFVKAARKLSDSRRKLALGLGSAVVGQLKDLAMEKAKFEVGFAEVDEPGAEGLDRAEFLFSANPGQPMRPLVKIASGGEISRVMLGLRSVLRKAHGSEVSVPIVIFDEVDTGIGGRTAEAVGQKMQEIALSHQVFCITHLPQIAKRADHHYRVEKSSGADSTKVDVVPLTGELRVEELARMMGEESVANLAHARTLLAEAGGR